MPAPRPPAAAAAAAATSALASALVPAPSRPAPAPLRRAQVKGQSERRPARPYAVALPGSHRGDWAVGASRLELHILSSLQPASPPWSRLGYILKMCFEGAI